MVYLSFPELALHALASDIPPNLSAFHTALQHVEGDRRQLGEHNVVCPGNGLSSRLALEIVPPTVHHSKCAVCKKQESLTPKDTLTRLHNLSRYTTEKDRCIKNSYIPRKVSIYNK